MQRLLVVLVLSLSACCPLVAVVPEAEPPPPQPEAQADPTFLEAYAATYRFRLGRPRGITPTPDGESVLFLRSGPRSFAQDLYTWSNATGEESVLLTADAVLDGAEENLSPEEKARRERKRETARGITGFQMTRDGARLLVPLGGRLYLVERATGAVQELVSQAGGFPLDPRLSPDGAHVGAVRDGDLYMIEVATGTERRLTTREGEHVSWGEAEFVAQEEMSRHEGYWWSPDGQLVVVQRTDVSAVERLYLADPADPAQAPQAWPYPRPGKANADVRLALFPVAGGEPTWIQWDRERYPYLATVRWQKQAPLTLVVQTRNQDEAAILTVDPAAGATEVLHVERDAAWLHIDQSVPRWIDEGRAFLWSTERDGMYRLERRGADGAKVADLTPLDLSYAELLHVDEATDVAWITADGPPTERHVYRVPLAAGAETVTKVSEGAGLHGAIFGRGDQALHARVHDRSDVVGLRTTVHDASGQPVGELKSVAESPPFEPRVEHLTLAIAERTHHAAIVRPRSFDTSLQYPVILYAYGGPLHAIVRARAASYLRDQFIADHGFLVVRMDARGTPNRGRAFERVIRGNLIDAALEDQVAGVKALTARYPEMDPARIGVYGWSFGGYFTAMATMRHPEVFRAGVAIAPVCDWRDYDTHYTERFLGLPADNPEGYERSNVLTWAPGLEVPLLILHGTVDDNVYFQHAVKMSDALFRAGKEHGFVPLSGFTHMVADPDYARRFYGRLVGWMTTHLGAPARRAPDAIVEPDGGM